MRNIGQSRAGSMISSYAMSSKRSYAAGMEVRMTRFYMQQKVQAFTWIDEHHAVEVLDTSWVEVIE
jgi:hypothetical protein